MKCLSYDINMKEKRIKMYFPYEEKEMHHHERIMN